MNINEHNYQAYILDYFEGNLSATKREELMAFLNAHPLYRKEFEEYEHIGLNDADEVFFSEKDELKKKTVLNDEEFFDYTEGNLSQQEKSDAEKIMAGNPALEKELRLWQNTKVSADLSVVFPAKEKLKRKPIVVPLWKNVYLRAAAVIVLVLGAGWIYFSNPPTETFAAMPLQKMNQDDFLTAVLALKIKDSSEKIKNTKGVSIPKKKVNTLPKNNFIVKSPGKVKSQKELQLKLQAQKDSTETRLAQEMQQKRLEIFRQQQRDSLEKIAKAHLEKADSMNAIAKTSADSLFKNETHGIWGPEEKLPGATKKKIGQKFLDVAVTCLRGLKKIGIKKADGVKKTNPANGDTDYTLVLGKYSYSTLK